MDKPLAETRYYAVGNFGFGGRPLPGRRTLVVKAKDNESGSWSRARLQGDGEKLANFLASILSPVALEAFQNALQDLMAEHEPPTTP